MNVSRTIEQACGCTCPASRTAQLLDNLTDAQWGRLHSHVMRAQPGITLGQAKQVITSFLLKGVSSDSDSSTTHNRTE